MGDGWVRDCVRNQSRVTASRVELVAVTKTCSNGSGR